MTKKKKTFTPEEKLSILREAEREGFMETCRKYNLSGSTVQYWKRKYLSKGSEGLKPGYRKVDPRVRELEEENERLKRIIAKQALKLEVKEELLKNGQAHWRKGKKS